MEQLSLVAHTPLTAAALDFTALLGSGTAT